MATLTSAKLASPIPHVPGLPVLGNLLQFRADRLGLQAAAARQGPIARLQFAHIPVYVVTDADLAHEVFVTKADQFRKSRGLNFLEPLLGDGLLTAEGEPHRRHRRLLAPAFAPKRLNVYGSVMVEETQRQVERWHHGRRIDLSHEMMEMTLAIAGRTMFGADLRSDAKQVARALDLAMSSHSASLNSLIQLGYKWPLPRHLEMRRAVKLLDEVVYRLIREGRARGTDRGDVLSILLLARDEEDGSGLTDRQVRDEAMTLLLAGHETTANALTWAWYELLRNPEALARLQAEVEALGSRAPTVEDLPKLAWTLAVLEEAMRMHPPAYMTGREAKQDITLAGHHFAKGSIILINILGIHRRADYFPAPHSFRPQRMLAEAKKARPRHHYLPFGGGPRVCIGAHFANIEGQLALATLARSTSFTLINRHVEADPMVTLRPRGGMPVIVEKREGVLR
jgi:cytochrome P450